MCLFQFWFLQHTCLEMVLLGHNQWFASLVAQMDVGELGLIPGLGGFLGEEHGLPHQYSCLENPHGQKSLVGYSAWGLKELDMTE